MFRTEIIIPPELTAMIVRATKASNQVRPLVRAAVKESALRVVSEAKRTVPVATGTLRASIKPQFLGDGTVAVIGSYVPYAPIVEYSEVSHPVIPRGSTYRNINGKEVTRRRKGNTNPDATWGFLRKSLYAEFPNFKKRLEQIARAFLGK